MTKSKDQKTKKPRTWNEAIVEASNTYDGTNYVYDGADDTIMTESEMLKKFTAQEKYEMLKKVANNQEKKEFREIERKYKKKKPIAQRTAPFSNKDDTGGAVKIDIAPFPFENTITHTYGAIEDVPVEEVKPREDLAKVKGGLVNILGVQDVKK